jgi:transcriptional regulator with XRE-family HTH domain
MSTDELRTRARTERRRRHLTQEQVAASVGMSARAYQMFEGGQTKPQPANLQAIVTYLYLENPPSNGDGERPELVWPADVQVFLDMLGAYLVAMTPAQRLAVIHDVTRQIFVAHSEGHPSGRGA